MKKIIIVFLVFFNTLVSFAKEARSITGWEGYFAERLDILDPIEGIYNVQFTDIYNGHLSQGDREVAIVRFAGPLFKIYEIDGRPTNYYIERIGSTKYYYLTFNNQKQFVRDRFALRDDGVFNFEHQLTDAEKKSFASNPNDAQYLSSRNWVWMNSGIKIYPDNNTEKTALPPTLWSGTCFSIGNGYLVTNHHVADNATLMNVYVDEQEGTSFPAKLVVKDVKNDLAILKISDNSFIGNEQVPYIIKRDKADVGSECFILGYPNTQLLGRELKYTNGTVSSLSGFQGDPCLYQISAPATGGNSGGPTFDNEGNVIGVLNSGVPSLDNVSYSIKAAYLLDLIEATGLEDELQTQNTLKSKEKTSLIKDLRKYVYFILCTNSETWDDTQKKEKQSPYIWELPKPKPHVYTLEELMKQMSNNDIKCSTKIPGACKETDISIHYSESALEEYKEPVEVLNKTFIPILETSLNAGPFFKFNFKNTGKPKSEFHILKVDDDGEIYGLLIFNDAPNRPMIYINGDGGRGKTTMLKSIAALKEASKDLLKVMKAYFKD